MAAVPCSGAIMSGVTGDRPAASAANVGLLYINTQTHVIERSNGATYDVLITGT